MREKNALEKISQMKHWFFERINNIDKALSKMIQMKKREATNKQCQ